MAVIPFSVSYVSAPGTTLDLVACTNVTRNNCKGTPALAFYLRSFLSTPVKLSLEKRRWSTPSSKSIIHTLAADAYRVANEEPVSAVPRENSAGKSNCLDDVIINRETAPWTTETCVNFDMKTKRRRPSRKSKMPPVKIEELLSGASFTGKVRSIQPFGAFVDIGAFTEGLIHISNLSDGFVKDVKSVVSIGQEVKVNVVKVNVEAGQISLTMRESHVSGDLQQKKGSSSGDKITKKRSKFVKGQELEGTVKNLRRGGSVTNLPEREEGSLPKLKQSVEDSVNVMGSPLMHVSQEVRPGESEVTPKQVSEVPPVKTEELVHGASFTGRVRSIQPFGAFVDIGAFAEGLVHISNMSDGFVSDIKNIVSIGQEVRVKVLETNVERRRISLTMRESYDINDLLQRKDSSSGDSTDKPLPATKNIARTKKKNSKFIKGQELEGTVKSLNRGGSVISLPEGEEGFLPRSEESVEGIVNVMGGSSLQVRQEISVRVLHVAKGQVTLTMKKEDDVKKQVPEVIHIGVVHKATNPFVLAFLKNKDIAKFLDEMENMQRLAESS